MHPLLASHQPRPFKVIALLLAGLFIVAAACSDGGDESPSGEGTEDTRIEDASPDTGDVETDEPACSAVPDTDEPLIHGEEPSEGDLCLFGDEARSMPIETDSGPVAPNAGEHVRARESVLDGKAILFLDSKRTPKFFNRYTNGGGILDFDLHVSQVIWYCNNQDPGTPFDVARFYRDTMGSELDGHDDEDLNFQGESTIDEWETALAQAAADTGLNDAFDAESRLCDPGLTVYDVYRVWLTYAAS